MMKYFSPAVMLSLDEVNGAERRLPKDPSGRMLCQVGSSSALEYRRVNSDGISLQVVGGLREIERGRKSLRVNYCWLTKNPREPQEYLSIRVSKRQTSLSEEIPNEMFAVQEL